MADPAPTIVPQDLARRSLGALAIFAIVFGVMLFAPAGTLAWVRGWLFWAVFNLCSLVLSLLVLKNDPALMARRLKGGPTAERETSQKQIQSVTAVLVVALFVVPAIDHRFGWSQVSWTVAILGELLVIIGFWMIHLTFKANSYASATVETSVGQTVISTGVYGVVRHPMYAGAAVMFIGAPLALGSWWGLIPGLLLLPALAWRLTDEEAFLVRNLPGYEDYRRKVRWRLLPFVW
jgi:protein-S-isoprenylcysteine O-methyltransferase Ste14